MADARIEDIPAGELTELADADKFVVLDASDTTDDADGTTKFVQFVNMKVITGTTEAAPVPAVSGDADTGLFAPSADALAVSAGGVEGFRVTETGGNPTTRVKSGARTVNESGTFIVENENASGDVGLVLTANTKFCHMFNDYSRDSLSIFYGTDSETSASLNTRLIEFAETGGSAQIKINGGSAALGTALVVKDTGDGAIWLDCSNEFDGILISTPTLTVNDEVSAAIEGRTSSARHKIVEFFDTAGVISTNLHGILRQDAEVTQTPSGTAATVTLSDGNLQTVSLASSTGNVTIDLDMPVSPATGNIIIKQHATTARDITWTEDASGSLIWLGTEPTWSSDATSAIRIVNWRFDGTDIYLWSTGSN